MALTDIPRFHIPDYMRRVINAFLSEENSYYYTSFSVCRRTKIVVSRIDLRSPCQASVERTYEMYSFMYYRSLTINFLFSLEIHNDSGRQLLEWINGPPMYERIQIFPDANLYILAAPIEPCHCH
jgi:hypothetical protein